MKYNILAVIPARGGSKGVPRKNIKILAGKPLIQWTIEAAQQSKYISRVILSSEDEEIIALAKSMGCDVPFTRPIELAQDTTQGIEPILHAVEMCPGYDYVMMLQPTTPLRTTKDIDGFIEHFFKNGANASVSVCEPTKTPFWMFQLKESKEFLTPLLPEHSKVQRRQDLPSVYALNGALYIAEINWLKGNKGFISGETIGYVMPQERSYDIDSIVDFKICEILKKEQISESYNGGK